MGFPRQEYWSGLPFPSPGDLPDQGIELRSPALQADSLPTELQAKLLISRVKRDKLKLEFIFQKLLRMWLYAKYLTPLICIPESERNLR